MNSTIHTIWIGDRLPRLQRRCIESWTVHGYDVRIVVYQDVANLPREVNILDGADFLPTIHRYSDERHADHPALQANLFRYAWLAKYGGTWVDADTACLKRLPDKAIIISSEAFRSDPYWFPDLAVCRVPPGAPFMLACDAEAKARLARRESRWGRFGPKLLHWGLVRQGMLDRKYVSAPRDYCPIPCWLAAAMYIPHAVALPRDSCACHMWASAENTIDHDPDTRQSPDSAFEQILAAATSDTCHGSSLSEPDHKECLTPAQGQTRSWPI